MDITIKDADWVADNNAIKAIRRHVFIEEQNVDEALEWDHHDSSALHFLALIDNQPVAVSRLQKNGQLGRMAVLKDFRGKGIGSLLIRHMLELQHSQLTTDIFLHAQAQAEAFYKKFGFSRQGCEFTEAGIVHYKMILTK
ncbi:MAG: GNAT family N-acetyltransferase [Gammaproteobacteria bacterium]|nr:GNAT family N-acetyltransferase [Gammaproteobacteria bacterium]